MAERNPVIVAVSGGFDPLHIGHVRLFQDAKALGDELVVILNNDNWLRFKKGEPFMREEERKEIIEAIGCVDRVVLTRHAPGTEDISVCEALREVRPHLFANGGDRKPDWTPVPEVAVCEELGIAMIYNIGRGGKMNSSSLLAAPDRLERECFCGSGLKFGACHGKSWSREVVESR